MDTVEHVVQCTFRYSLYFTSDVFAADNSLLRDVVAGGEGRRSRLLFVIDRGLARSNPRLTGRVEAYVAAHDAAVELACPPLVMPGGESAKNSHDHVAALHEIVADAGLCRHSYVVAVGGGALLDVVGYAAATAQRGLRLVRVPTTTLAQADAGVAVTATLNGCGRKDFVGTFAPPTAVLNDSAVLTTLDDRDWLGGLAEAIKIALTSDRELFESIELNAPRLAGRDLAAMTSVVQGSARLHLAATEAASPAALFGHWAAFKLEILTDFRLSHGEAVAIGVALDTTYSYLAGLLREDEWRRVITTLSALRFNLYVPELRAQLGDAENPRSLVRGLAEFRERRGGPLAITLPRAIGKAVESPAVGLGLVRRSIAVLETAATRSLVA